jgi:uncharacterized protein
MIATRSMPPLCHRPYSVAMTDNPRVTYLLVDGENVDATLGISVLGRRPNPDERPRWERLRTYAAEAWGQPVKPLFFLNASAGHMPMPFVQALLALDYRPIPLSGDPGVKVVDLGIQRTLEAIEAQGGDVLLASHDGDFLPQVKALLGADRRVGIVGFREYVNAQFSDLREAGLQFFDLEYDVNAFSGVLPRVRIIPIERFNPLEFL